MAKETRLFRPLDSQERAIMEKLLSYAFAGREELLEQARTARVTRVESPGAPAFVFATDPATPPAMVQDPIPVEAVGKDADGHSVHFLLHVADRRLREIEIYREDGGRLQRMPEAATLERQSY